MFFFLILFTFLKGGCGSMYEVYVSSKDFEGKRMVQQHRLVTEVQYYNMYCGISLEGRCFKADRSFKTNSCL